MEEVILMIDLNSGDTRVKEGSGIQNDKSQKLSYGDGARKHLSELQVEKSALSQVKEANILCSPNDRMGNNLSSSNAGVRVPNSSTNSKALEEAWRRSFEFETKKGVERNDAASSASEDSLFGPASTELKKKENKVPDSNEKKTGTNYISLKSNSRLVDSAPSIRDPFTSSYRGKIPGAKKEEEEEDPFKYADLPEKYRKGKFGLRRGFWSLLQWCALLVSVSFLICSLTIRNMKNKSIWSLELWKWAVAVATVFCGHLVSGWLIHIIVFFIEKNFMLRKRVVYFVYGLQHGVQTCLWVAFVLLAWTLLFNPKADLNKRHHRALMYVTKLIICFLIAAVLWLIKLLGLKTLAMHYHVSNYFERIQQVLFHEHILQSLSGPPLYSESHDDDDEENVAPKKNSTEDAKDAITVTRLKKLTKKNVSAWNMKRLMMKVKQQGLSTLSQRLGDPVLDQENEIKNDFEAKMTAKQIFRNVAETEKRYITVEDFKRFMPEEDAEKAFSMFNGAIETGNITKNCLVNWVVDVYQERRELALSLNDAQTAVHQLHKIVNILLIILIIIVSFIVLGIATTKVLALVLGQVLVLSFVFNNACKTAFEALVFLFIMHPYDVGDRCVIDGVQMVVEEMNILTTVFLKFDNEKVYYPNAVLASKPISNFRRSPEMGDSITFDIHISTTMDQIANLRAKIQRYIENNLHQWRAKHAVNVKEIENMNKMKMSLFVQHASNHQNPGERAARISDLILELRASCQELGIQYRLPAQEIHLSTPNTTLHTRA